MYAKIAVFLLVIVCSNGAFSRSEPMAECGPGKITCVCGIGDTKRYKLLDLEMNNIEDPATGKSKCVVIEDPYQACAKESCFLASSEYEPAPKKDLVSSFYPHEFTVPNGGVKHRFTRESGPCHVPSLNNAVVKCWKWPDWMNCDITCIYGHAFQDGKETSMTKNINCRNSENVWKPHGFRDCEPYLNCKVQLVKPGELKCREPIDGPAYCEISCLDYEDDEPTSLQKYECVDESFGSNLPHCAVLKEKVSLLRKP